MDPHETLASQNAQPKTIKDPGAEESDILRRAHEAMTDGDQIAEGYAQTAETNQKRSMGRVGRALAIGVSALAIAGASEAKSPAAAEASGNKTDITNIETDVFAQVGSKSYSTDSAIAKGKVKFLGYVRAKGLPRKFVNKDRCDWVNGGYNSGSRINSPNRPRRVKDVSWFYTNKREYVCKVPKRLSPTGYAIARCNNFFKRVKPPRVRLVKAPVVMVRNIARAKVNVRASSTAEARAECRTRDGLSYAMGYGRGTGLAGGRVRLETLLRAKGRGNVVSRISGEANAEARSGATANAEAYCASSRTTPTTTPEKPPEEPENKPPKGDMKPPNHLYSEGYGKVCVDNIYDPEGGPVSAYNFRVYKQGDPNKAGIGRFEGDVYPEPGGAQCRNYKAPYTNYDYKAVSTASLTDGRNNVEANPATYDFNILNDEF